MAEAEVSITLGYSSLGLPRADRGREWAPMMDVVLGEADFDLVEIHPSRMDADARDEVVAQARAVRARGGEVVLGMGARHLLSAQKHEPSLICADASGHARRVELLREALALAADVGANRLIFLSGPSAELCRAGARKVADPAWARLCQGLEQLLPVAEQRGVVLALEAHSGHVISSVADIEGLYAHFDSPWLGFTADTVHQAIIEEQPLRAVYRRAAPIIRHVQLDNTSNAQGSTQPVQHLLLDGAGRVDVGEVMAGLIAGGYAGCVSVEFLSEDPYAAGVDALDYCRRIGPWLRRRLDDAKEQAHDASAG